MLIEQTVKNAKFVLSKDESSYKEVLDDFNNSNEIYILTFNISAEEEELIKRLKKLDSDVNVHIVTNIPKRFDKYYYQHNRYAAKKLISTYIHKLSPSNFKAQIVPFFNFDNHAKIISTDNIAYVGSANFSDESKDHFESGLIIKDQEFIEFLKDTVFPELINHSEPYYEDEFMEIKIFVSSVFPKLFSLNKKFEYEFFDYNDHVGKFYRIDGEFNVDTTELEDLEIELYELQDILKIIENKSTMIARMDELRNIVDKSKIQNILKLVEYDGKIFEACKFNYQDFCDRYLEKHAIECDDVDKCLERASEEAFEIFEEIAIESKDDIIELNELFIRLIEEISNLNIKLHKISDTNAKIDNT